MTKNIPEPGESLHDIAAEQRLDLCPDCGLPQPGAHKYETCVLDPEEPEIIPDEEDVVSMDEHLER